MCQGAGGRQRKSVPSAYLPSISLLAETLRTTPPQGGRLLGVEHVQVRESATRLLDPRRVGLARRLLPRELVEQGPQPPPLRPRQADDGVDRDARDPLARPLARDVRLLLVDLEPLLADDAGREPLQGRHLLRVVAGEGEVVSVPAV